MKVIANSCRCALRHDDTDGNPKQQIESNPHCISPHSSCPTLLLGSLGFSWLEGRAIIALVRAEETEPLNQFKRFRCAVIYSKARQLLLTQSLAGHRRPQPMAGRCSPMMNANTQRRRNEKSKLCKKDYGAGNGARVFGRFERHAC